MLRSAAGFPDSGYGIYWIEVHPSDKANLPFEQLGRTYFMRLLEVSLNDHFRRFVAKKIVFDKANYYIVTISLFILHHILALTLTCYLKIAFL